MTKCLIASPMDLMKRYLDGKDALSNNEREILLFALYMESDGHEGLAWRAKKQMGVWVSPRPIAGILAKRPVERKESE